MAKFYIYTWKENYFSKLISLLYHFYLNNEYFYPAVFVANLAKIFYCIFTYFNLFCQIILCLLEEQCRELNSQCCVFCLQYKNGILKYFNQEFCHFFFFYTIVDKECTLYISLKCISALTQKLIAQIFLFHSLSFK